MDWQASIDYVHPDNAGSFRGSAWTAWNPDKPVQPPCTRNEVTKRSMAQLATMAAKKKQKRDKEAELMEEIDKYFIECDKFIEETTTKFSKKPSAIQDLVNHASRLKLHRGPSLQNALVYYKSIEVNQGKNWIDFSAISVYKLTFL